LAKVRRPAPRESLASSGNALKLGQAGDYYISFGRSARKELEHISGDVAERILAKLEALKKRKIPDGRCNQSCTGQKKYMRMRVGDYSVGSSMMIFPTV